MAIEYINHGRAGSTKESGKDGVPEGVDENDVHGQIASGHHAEHDVQSRTSGSHVYEER